MFVFLWYTSRIPRILHYTPPVTQEFFEGGFIPGCWLKLPLPMVTRNPHQRTHQLRLVVHRNPTIHCNLCCLLLNPTSSAAKHLQFFFVWQERKKTARGVLYFWFTPPPFCAIIYPVSLTNENTSCFLHHSWLAPQTPQNRLGSAARNAFAHDVALRRFAATLQTHRISKIKNYGSIDPK